MAKTRNREIVRAKRHRVKTPTKEFTRVVSNMIMGKDGSLSPALKGRVESLTTEQDSDDAVDPILITAQYIVDLLATQTLTVSRLTHTQWNQLAYYFFKTNYIVYRAISLKTKIPMSVYTLNKPKVADNDLIQDYVFDFYDTNLKEVNFRDKITTAGYHLNLFGKAYILVQTNNNDESDTIIDLQTLRKKKRIVISEEDKAFISKTVEQYNVDPDKISHEDVQKVIDLTFPFETKFSGIKGLTVISPFDVIEEKYNDEVDYKEIDIPVSPFIKSYYDEEKVTHSATPEEALEKMVKKMVKIGYSNQYATMNLVAIQKGEKSISVTNDVSEDCFFIELNLNETGGDSTPLTSLFPDLVALEITKMKELKAINSTDKIVKVVSSTEATPDELANFSDDVTTSLQQGDYSTITTNYDISVEDIEFSFKSQLGDTDSDNTEDKVISGLGIPASLIAGDDTYGSAFIQVQTLNLEMQQFVNGMVSQIEQTLFTAMATKKGFITFNVFGKPIPVTPKVSFYKGSVLSDDFVNMISELVSDGKLPTAALLENILGFDFEETQKQMKEEQEFKTKLGIED